jgi:hypothetical protein
MIQLKQVTSDSKRVHHIAHIAYRVFRKLRNATPDAIPSMITASTFPLSVSGPGNSWEHYQKLLHWTRRGRGVPTTGRCRRHVMPVPRTQDIGWSPMQIARRY